jgi:tRNA 2-thiocytidine biosynthesis protein TtcA
MERYKEIERSIITTYRGKIWAPFIKALKEYELLKENDHICVCISGGKDSFLLAKCFQELKRHSDFPFEVTFMVMDPGYLPENRALIESNAKEMNIPIKIVNSDIFQITDNVGGKPCYLCARMRRGCLYKNASLLGCNKIALGHHMDDVIETTLMSMFYNGKFQTMMPKLKSDNYSGMEVIRPLYLVREKDIVAWKKHNDLNFLQCACRLTANSLEYGEGAMDSKRKEMKNLIAELKKVNPGVEQNIFMAHHNVNLDTCIGYEQDRTKHSFFEWYDKNGD